MTVNPSPSEAQQTKSSSWLADHPVVVIVGLIAAIIVIITFITGAISLPDLLGKNLQKQIVGTWLDSDGNTMTFFKDGTFQSGGPVPATGSYMFIDKNHLRLEMGGLFAIAGSQVFQVNISRDQMSFTDSAGQSFVFQRVR